MEAGKRLNVKTVYNNFDNTPLFCIFTDIPVLFTTFHLVKLVRPVNAIIPLSDRQTKRMVLPKV